MTSHISLRALGLALIIALSTTGSVSAKTEAGAGIGVNVSTETEVETEESALETNSTLYATSSASGEVRTNDRDDVMETEEEDSTATTVGIRGMLLLREDTGEKSNSSTSPVLSSEVDSRGELKTYGNAVMMEDGNLKSISFTDQSATVEYKEHAKLLGFIPVLVNVRVEALADGSVTVHYPWYRFLLITNESKLKTDLETAAKVTLEDSSSQSNTALSVSTQARLVDGLHTVLKRNFEAGASANANTNVEIE